MHGVVDLEVMNVATWCATAVHGGCCRTSFRPGRMCIAPSGAGLREASSSRCMIGYGNCGAAARNARRSRVRRCWMRNRPAVLRRAVRAAMMPARRSRAASATEQGERGPRSAPELAPPAGQCCGDATAVNTPVVPVATHAVAQDRFNLCYCFRRIKGI